MNLLHHDLIEYIYTFLYPKPCRSRYLILDKEMNNRFLNSTILCCVQGDPEIFFCEKHLYCEFKVTSYPFNTF